MARLRAVALCSVLTTSTAIGIVNDLEDGLLMPVDAIMGPSYLSLVPEWLRAYELSDEALDVGLRFSQDQEDPRYGPDGLTLTRSQPMTMDDVKAFVRSISRNSQELPDGADTAATDRMIQLAASDAGGSKRLGNLIDLWWYQQTFPSHTRGEQNLTSHLATIGGIYETFSPVEWSDESTLYYKQCPKTEHCFGRWLAEDVQYAKPEKAQHAADSTRLTLVRDLLDDRYGIYHPHAVKDYMMPELHDDLREAVERYARERDPTLLVEPKAEAVVHYRVGDVLDNEPPIHPKSLARALASLSPQPKTIELLNGGFSFGPSSHKGANIKFSVWLLKMLSDEIFKFLPNSTVTVPTAASVKHGTVDQDWAKLVNAKSMVCGAGSFGFSAAVARDHSDPTTQTRTPAYWNGIFPCSTTHYDTDSWFDHGVNTTVKDLSDQQPVERHMMHESNRWRLYPYDCTRQQDSTVPLAQSAVSHRRFRRRRRD